MRFLPAAFAALSLAFALGACSEPSAALKPVKTSAAALEQRIDALQTAAFTDKSAKEADIKALLAALPADITVKVGATRFDAASGATILSGVEVAAASRPDASLVIEEVKVWDLDTAFAIARLKGERLNDTARLARRIEAKGVSTRGLETLMAPALDAYKNSVAGALTAGGDGSEAVAAQMAGAMDIDVSKYSFTMSRAILSDVVLRPYAMTPAKIAADSEWASILPIVQTWAAWSRAVAVDTAAWYDVKADFDASQSGIDTRVQASVASIGVRGMRGGDTDFTLVRGVSYASDMALPAETPDQPAHPVSVSLDMDRYSHEGLRLNKILGYVADGVMPPRKETSLLSLGIIRYGRQKLGMFGETISETKSGLIDLSGFHWLIPTRIRLEADDVSYDIAALRHAMDRIAPGDPAAQAEADARSDEILAKLKTYGLDKPSFDAKVSWDWNALTGVAKLGLGGALNQYLKTDAALSVDFPSYKQVSDLVPEGEQPADAPPMDQGKLATLFEDESKFVGFHLELAEDGDIGRLFELAHDLGQFGSPDDELMSMLASMSPEDMRREAAARLFDMSRQASAQDPRGSELLLKASEWVGKGGTLRVEANPKKPVPLTSFGDVLMVGDTSILDQLGVKITHTPRAGAPAAAKPAEKPAPN